jgi:GH24 family phage-related lysozyme (muramidase)
MRRINQEGLQIIKDCESLKLKAYFCPAGVPTIGWGHTKGVKIGDIITEAQAEQYLADDLDNFEKGVDTMLTHNATDNQFSACVSLAFNVGLSNFSISNVRKFTNEGKPEQAQAYFKSFVRGGGVVLPGLVKRREMERKLFIKPDKPAENSKEKSEEKKVSILDYAINFLQSLKK